MGLEHQWEGPGLHSAQPHPPSGVHLCCYKITLRAPDETGSLTHFWWEYRVIWLLWKAVWRFQLELDIQSLCDPAVALWGVCPGEAKASVHTKTWTMHS